MKSPSRFTALLLLVSFVLNSCGVIFGGSKFRGTIHVKEHPNTFVSVDGMKMGKGGAIGLFKRNRPLVIELKQEGCEPKTVTFGNKFRTWNFIGNVPWAVLAIGIVGMAVDFGTGACFKPDDKAPGVERVSTKDFTFNVDYSDCTAE
jgi:hypothetical protein